jgi:hypothetical protein
MVRSSLTGLGAPNKSADKNSIFGGEFVGRSERRLQVAWLEPLHCWAHESPVHLRNSSNPESDNMLSPMFQRHRAWPHGHANYHPA